MLKIKDNFHVITVDINYFNVYICDMKLKQTRKYEMSNRAQSAEKTSVDILRVLGELWIKHSINEITLEMVAEKAGISVRTILRKYGSKEGLFEAAIKTDAAGIEAIKDKAETGNIAQAVELLMVEYERTGMAGIRTLAIEHDVPFAAKVLKKARTMHMEWCKRVFSPYLPEPADKLYSVRLGTFYAATDIYKWKLLRKDLGYSRSDTALIFTETLHGIIQSGK
jgi:AcrR family transcriptional regulator